MHIAIQTILLAHCEDQSVHFKFVFYSLRFLLHKYNDRDHTRPASSILRLQISVFWLNQHTERSNREVVSTFYIFKTQLLELLTRWEDSFIYFMLHAFHTYIFAFRIFTTWPFNNQKLLPELWCFNNSFWISRKFSRQPRVISKRRSKALLRASWKGNKAILQVKLISKTTTC